MRPDWMGEALRFAIVGGTATALHYGVYWELQRITSVDVAYTLGYLFAFAANFYATAYFTFGTSPSWRRLAGMGAAHGVNYVLHMGLLHLFLWAGVPQVWAPVPVFTIAIPVNFVLVRHVFKFLKT